MTRKDDSTARAMDGLRSLVRALGASARTASRDGGVSGAQLFALRQIHAHPGIGVSELASLTLARQSTVSELVSRLVAQGLVRRETSGDDARHALLTLSAKGQRSIGNSEPTAQERLVAGLEALPAKVRTGLADGIGLWLEKSGLAHVTPAMFFENEGKPPRE
jgi:DNA-binding MarR family transcriptional regulator